MFLQLIILELRQLSFSFISVEVSEAVVTGGFVWVSLYCFINLQVRSVSNLI